MKSIRLPYPALLALKIIATILLVATFIFSFMLCMWVVKEDANFKDWIIYFGLCILGVLGACLSLLGIQRLWPKYITP
jgi:hypothetical protein